MSDYARSTIGSGYNTSAAVNTELTKVETAISRKLDTTGDAMTGDLDLNSNDLLNIGAINGQTLTIGGVQIVAGTSTLSPLDALMTSDDVESGDVVYFDGTEWVLVNLALTTTDLTAAYAWTGTHTFTTNPTVNGNEVYHEGNITEAVTPINAQTGTTYTTVLSDRASVITMDNVASNTITIPPNASVAYPVGTILTVRQKGAGTTTIAEGAGVTITYPVSKGLVIGEQGEWASLIQETTDNWHLAGVTIP